MHTTIATTRPGFFLHVPGEETSDEGTSPCFVTPASVPAWAWA